VFIIDYSGLSMKLFETFHHKEFKKEYMEYFQVKITLNDTQPLPLLVSLMIHASIYKGNLIWEKSQ